MRRICSVTILIVCASLIVIGQANIDPRLQTQLKQLFPSASGFSGKELSPPHFNAFANDAAGARQLLGVAFWTTELEPLERGYHGPIKMLVGMNTSGILTGVIVVEDHEPYGDFSIERKEFAAQFAGKDIRDPFKVGQDVDAVSRASISISSATRAIRNSARRVARELLSPPTTKSAAAER